MIVAALIYRSYSLGVLLIVGMIGAYTISVCGVVAGVLIFLQGFRLLRRRSVSAQSHQGVETIDVSTRGFTLPLKPISVSVGSRDSSREGSADAEVGIDEISQHISAQYGSHLELVRLSPEPTPLRASEMSQQQKIAAALFKAGMSNSALWDTAELRANGGGQALNTPAPGDAERFRDQSKSDTDKANGFDPEPLGVLTEGANRKRFLLSQRSQQEAARALGWEYILMIFGGPALALLSLYFLLKIKSLF